MRENDFKKLDLSFLTLERKEEIKKTLERALKEIEKIKWPIQAIVLGGGYKHKEIGPGSDIDLFLFSNFIPFFWGKLSKIEKEIKKESEIGFHYRGVIPFLLKKSRTFWAYRLKREGIVLKGNENVLEKLQATENNIPKIEAIRILFQTLVVWLKLAEVSLKREKITPPLILRSYLNIGESYLTFFRSLKPSYKERMKEIEKKSKELKIEEKLKKRIILGYLTKVNPEKAEKEWSKFQISLSEAKKDCIEAIDNLLSLYLKSNLSLEEKLRILEKELKPRYFLNLSFFYFLKKKIKEIRPKFFPILLKFKIIDLWKMAIFNEKGEREKLFKLLKKYFQVKEFSDKTLIKIFEAHPSLSTVEIT